jgi:SAM-dependent methyltransferase
VQYVGVGEVAAPKFRPDLYKGTAAYYDRFRPPYPESLFADLQARVPISGEGRLLDLACGTGQIAFPLSGAFRETVAIDAEPETIAFASAKPTRLGPPGIRWLVGTAESPPVDGRFELIAIGTAFHRLDRPAVARRMRELIADTGAVVLLWSPVPSDGDAPWQHELRQIIIDWLDRSASGDRMPSGWQEALAATTDRQVLEQAGFTYSGRFEFTREDTWTVDSLIGFMYSTSILSRAALGGSIAAFEADLARRMSRLSTDGTFKHIVNCAYELARPAREATAL